MPSRHEQIGAYYADNGDRVERTVASHVNAKGTVVEDACAVAWCQLLRRPDVRLGVDGFWWLYRVAVHEAWRLVRELRREPTIDHTEHAKTLAALAVASTAEARAKMRAPDELPERQACLVLLHAYGFTYAEIARMTGATYRTIDRQIRRARQRLRDAERQSLAAREQAVLDRLVEGLTLRAIAIDLDLCEQTVSEYLADAYRKLGDAPALKPSPLASPSAAGQPTPASARVCARRPRTRAPFDRVDPGSFDLSRRVISRPRSDLGDRERRANPGLRGTGRSW